MLLRKKKGGIDKPDDEYLEQLMAENEDVSRLWDDIRQNDFDEKAWYDIADSETAWNEVEHELLRRKRAVRYLSVKKWLAAAAVSGVIAAGAYFLLNKARESSPASPVTATAEMPANGLHLQMANGKVIQLPYNMPAQDISAGSVALNAGARTLQYTSKGKDIGGYNTLVVPPKMDYRVILSDGTEVWLNATSTLKFPFSFRQNTREVYLEGEGFFKVAKNADKPFFVRTPETVIEVLGTEFNVNTYKRGITSTSLVTGAVSARSGSSTIVLKPGQEAVYTERSGFTVQQFDKDAVVSWMNGIFQFDDTRLADLQPVIERWFGIAVVFDDPALANSPFTGILDKHHDLAFFLKNLKNTGIGIDYYFREETLHLKSAH